MKGEKKKSETKGRLKSKFYKRLIIFYQSQGQTFSVRIQRTFLIANIAENRDEDNLSIMFHVLVQLLPRCTQN